ncbi:peroxiredoxin-like family protein [Actinospica robiniae]|uniref:peroxiredoxin-like family protein n=1 Tax=Actinospica robiniae TaxID=304901 RepID=UPI001B7F8D52|nr:peroxiredoxin-like family protein [Actinospica robiniae]
MEGEMTRNASGRVSAEVSGEQRAAGSRGAVRIAPFDVVGRRELRTVEGEAVAVPDAGQLTHLQFRRFAGCPVCNLHLRSMTRRESEIKAAGVREVVFFHAPADELRRYVADIPFAVVGDPEKVAYREFGVEAAPRALLDPRVWPTIARAVGVGLWDVLRGRKPMLPSGTPHGGRVGLPADFLIAPDGTVLAVKYGAHAGDQWSVDELLGLVREVRWSGQAGV